VVAGSAHPWSFRRADGVLLATGLRRRMRGAAEADTRVRVRDCGRRLESGDGEEMIEVRVYSAIFIVCLWAWASMFIWASFSLYAYTCLLESLAGNRGRGWSGRSYPASPDEDYFWSVKIPAGTKNPPIAFPNGGIPHR
jgi:hypothetical protein